MLKKIFEILRNYLNQVLIRFPMESVYTIVGTIGLFFLIGNYPGLDEPTSLVKLLMVVVIGFLLTLGISLLFEKEKYSNSFKYLLYLLILAFICVYYNILPYDINLFFIKDQIIYFILLVCSFLFLFLLPYIGDKDLNSYWIFIVEVFKRFIISFVYGLILYFGLAILLVSLDYLFGIKIYQEYYFQLWAFIFGFFIISFFLYGIPNNYSELSGLGYINKYSIILGKYILFPLLAMYVLILFSYGLKIFITGDWPLGGVIMLIFWYTIVGFTHFFILYNKYLESNKEKWLKFQYMFFFISILPLLFLYFKAIWLRIDAYGLTINRYYIVLYGFFLLFIGIFYSFNKLKNLKVLIISIFAISLFSLIGPWSGFNLSKNSQFNRLEVILKEKGILVNGKISPLKSDELDYNTKNNISSILLYLVQFHGYKSFQKWFNEDVDFLLHDSNGSRISGAYQIKNNLMNKFGLESSYGYDISYSNNYYFNLDNTEPISVSGYDYYLNINYYNKGTDSDIFQYSLDGNSISIKLNSYSKNIIITINNDIERKIELSTLFSQLTNLSRNERNMTLKSDSLTVKNDNIKLIITNLGIVSYNGNIEIQNLEGKLFVTNENQ